MHGRQLVTRLGMAASPGSRGPITTARTAAGTTPTGWLLLAHVIWRAFIMTGAMLGLRPGELLGVRWEDVDLDAGLLRVRQSLKRNLNAAGRDRLAPGALKTEQSKRTLRMPARVRQALAALRREQAGQRLRLGVPLHRQRAGVL